jgi:hypothetical protein
MEHVFSAAAIGKRTKWYIGNALDSYFRGSAFDSRVVCLLVLSLLLGTSANGR